ncbi:MAG: hypothetical protein MI975_01590 [Cytophagales bacterium]|nr:hypothetical protein [Cytophagales bacterium]
MKTKPRVLKDYEKLDDSILAQIKVSYPYGFSGYLITYVDRDGKTRTALPFETDDKFYLVRMTESEALQIIEEDEDFIEDGMIKNELEEEFEQGPTDVDVSKESKPEETLDNKEEFIG